MGLRIVNRRQTPTPAITTIAAELDRMISAPPASPSDMRERIIAGISKMRGATRAPFRPEDIAAHAEYLIKSQPVQSKASQLAVDVATLLDLI